MRFPDANDVAEQLADRAEAVCRKYLPKGFKSGNYWMIGDATGVPGKSMHVRLHGPRAGRGAAGKWSEYVAAVVMLPFSSQSLSGWRSARSSQHNAGTRGV